MAIRFDEQARDAIARRRSRGQDAAVTLQVTHIPHGGGRIAAGWSSRTKKAPTLAERRVGDDTAYVEESIARYASWRDVTVSSWRLWRHDMLVVVDEPLVMCDLAIWRRTHPGLQRAGA